MTTYHNPSSESERKLYIKDMDKIKELNQRLLFFTPEITFDGMIGGVKLVMLVDAFNRHINWIVYEGDHCSEFSDFQEACAYYVKAICEE